MNLSSALPALPAGVLAVEFARSYYSSLKFGIFFFFLLIFVLFFFSSSLPGIMHRIVAASVARLGGQRLRSGETRGSPEFLPLSRASSLDRESISIGSARGCESVSRRILNLCLLSFLSTLFFTSSFSTPPPLLLPPPLPLPLPHRHFSLSPSLSSRNLSLSFFMFFVRLPVSLSPYIRLFFSRYATTRYLVTP